MKSLLILQAVALCILGCNTCNAENLDSQFLQSLGGVKYHELVSAKLDRSFYIFVDLPENYSSSKESYPTVYLLDGGITFPLLASYQHYLRFGDETPAAILVGISYGADTFEEGNLRSTDFTAPSQEREFWGGAQAFQQVLEHELIPLIEKNYRTDPSSRVLFGQSLGGQFVLYNALTKPELFFGHIASNPALHRNLPFFLKWQGQNAIPTSTSHVFVSSGEYNDPRFREPALAWIKQWQSSPTKPWRLETRTLKGQSHFSAAPEAYRQGLIWLFEK